MAIEWCIASEFAKIVSLVVLVEPVGMRYPDFATRISHHMLQLKPFDVRRSEEGRRAEERL